MKEKELSELFDKIFRSSLVILDNLKKGFFGQNVSLIQDSENKFHDILISSLPAVEKIISEKEKDAAETKYVILLPKLQTIALAIENLMFKMEAKVSSRILFSQKALSEIEALYDAMMDQFRNTKDYMTTKNPALKAATRKNMETIFKMVEEFSVVHQNRLITGICMPQASYLYIDITDSLKRISRGLMDFTEKV